MNDFKFTRALFNNEAAKTNSKFVKMNDVDRINRIHDNMNSMFPKKNQIVQPVVKQENHDIFKSRIDAINNIKKD